MAFREAGIEGNAFADLVIDGGGTPSQLEWVGAAGIEFAPAAIETVRQWRYSPAMKDGAVVRCRLQIAVEYLLNS